ncbi:YdeI/OmpD-associated family protein [Bacillus massiliigorillae]|uniref:YdeI/OmpD-associated family protein n=1 Tax=Bacillus massiliigorillae TaxID=1243664 RepID=UPI0003A3B089|nr:YdeI/OmpD-associated family protein [Bacillus massiliigorillae]
MNSTKTIIEKLNLNKYPSKAILHIPEDIHDFQELQYDTFLEKEKYDLIFTFIFSEADFLKRLQQFIDKQCMNDKGYVFFAYPKKNNRQYKEYIERDRFFEIIPVDEEGYVKGSELKFSRMVSFNDVFTVVGLKSEVKKAKSTKKSQCVDDYIEHVDDIKQYLTKNEELLSFYNSLTFGYQKDWARYVYSAKRKETQEKRLAEMDTILGEGYKSIDLYRRRSK